MSSLSVVRPAPAQRRRGSQLRGLTGDLAALVPVVARLPGALRHRHAYISVDAARPTAHHPVLLLHGYGGSGAVWNGLSAGLQRAGFGYLLRVSYNSLSGNLNDLMRCIADHAEDAVRRTGAPGVHLVGHSLGGLLARYAAHHLTHVGVTSVVTISAPHGGLPLARVAPGSLAGLMQRGYPLPAPDGRSAPGSRWIAFYSDGDRLVPPALARLDGPGFAAANVLVPGRGHLTICRDPRLIDGVVRELLGSESIPQAAAA